MEYDKYFGVKDLYIVDTDTGVDDAIALLQEYFFKKLQRLPFHFYLENCIINRGGLKIVKKYD